MHEKQIQVSKWTILILKKKTYGKINKKAKRHLQHVAEDKTSYTIISTIQYDLSWKTKAVIKRKRTHEKESTKEQDQHQVLNPLSTRNATISSTLAT